MLFTMLYNVHNVQGNVTFCDAIGPHDRSSFPLLLGRSEIRQRGRSEQNRRGRV